MTSPGKRRIRQLWGKVLDWAQEQLSRPDPPDPRAVSEIVKILESAQRALVGESGSLRIIHSVPRPKKETSLGE